jgi:hypothetical protein
MIGARLHFFLLIATLVWLQYSCVHDGNSKLNEKLDDAVQRHASIDERIIDWGAPSGKDSLSDGRMVYTWKLPWTSHHVNYNTKGNTAYATQHVCTIVITAFEDNTIQTYNYRDC